MSEMQYSCGLCEGYLSDGLCIECGATICLSPHECLGEVGDIDLKAIPVILEDGDGSEKFICKKCLDERYEDVGIYYQMPCPECDDGIVQIPCSFCNGGDVCWPTDMSKALKCTICDGSGELDATCYLCDGNGSIYVQVVKRKHEA